MEAVATRFLAARRLTDRPSTVATLEHALREFLAWLYQVEPQVETFADVTRDHLLAYGEYLATTRSPRTGRPYAFFSRRGRMAALAVFFRQIAQWHWVPRWSGVRRDEIRRLQLDSWILILTALRVCESLPARRSANGWYR